MKNSVLFFLSLFFTCSIYAQDTFTKVLINSPFKNTFNSANVEQAIHELSDVWKVDENGVSFTIIVENLHLSSSEIFKYSKEYLEEAYRPTKYNIENTNEEKHFVVGKGEFNSFESYSAFPNQYKFNCEHRLRIDAKDGRARISLSLSEYNILVLNGNKNDRLKVKIQDVSPANPDADKSRKMYNKAFLALSKLAIGTLYDIQDMLKSKTSIEMGTDW